MKKQNITLKVGNTEFIFKVDIIKYNNFLNSSSGKNKIQAVQNFLVGCCDGDDKKAELRNLFNNNPGAPTALLESILEEFAPDVAVVVKKSETEPSE
jgi:hypothetical protein